MVNFVEMVYRIVTGENPYATCNYSIYKWKRSKLCKARRRYLEGKRKIDLEFRSESTRMMVQWLHWFVIRDFLPYDVRQNFLLDINRVRFIASFKEKILKAKIQNSDGHTPDYYQEFADQIMIIAKKYRIDHLVERYYPDMMLLI